MIRIKDNDKKNKSSKDLDINPQKTNVNIIQINTSTKHSNSKSPDYSKNEKPKQTPKGVNIIPLKNFNRDLTSEKFSPRVVTNKSPTNMNNISKTSGGSKLPQSSRPNDNKFGLESKTSYKSPSPNRGTNSVSNKYLKKSPEIKK